MKLLSIQYLRAVAALAVVICHSAPMALGRSGMFSGVFAGGSYGVDLFFVISGFIMFYTTAESRMTAGAFLKRRAIRIVPIYAILTTLAYLLTLLAPAFYPYGTPVLGDYVRSLLFIPYMNQATHFVQPEIPQGWTLNFEAYFYLCFAAGLMMRREFRLPFCFLLFAGLAVISHFFPTLQRYEIWNVCSGNLNFEFLYGMILGYVFALHPGRLPSLVLIFVVAGAAAVACLAFPALAAALHVSDKRFLLIGLPSAAIVATALWAEQRGHVPHSLSLLALGNASYSLYLSHILVLDAVALCWRLLVGGHSPWESGTLLTVLLATAVAVALALYRFVEAPISRSLHKHFTARLPSAATVTAS